MATPTAPSDTHWPDYYEVTAERPPWGTLTRAADASGPVTVTAPPLAVDLGCGAGRDTRELLRRGWRVLAVDKTPEGLERLRQLTPEDQLDRLETRLADLVDFEIPACDLVNANLILPFLDAPAYAAAWERISAALPAGGRVSAMLFGDRDGSADDPAMTCPTVDEIRAHLSAFELEHWQETEEDRDTALGEPHHFHLIEVVAVRRAIPAPADVG
jgi:SAM-dependent methyltransferase